VPALLAILLFSSSKVKWNNGQNILVSILRFISDFIEYNFVYFFNFLNNFTFSCSFRLYSIDCGFPDVPYFG
jgi:hypothetical protein